MKKNLFFIFCIGLSQFCLAQANKSIDSAKRTIYSNTEEATYIKTCFYIADSYMDVEQYDSAQIWLNKIHEKLPVKATSLNNYFLLTRQAEVYYYNNLQQLGLQESQKGLDMAKALNDSLLLADSYNFLGLFLMNMDSAAEAIPYFTKGLPYTKQPPFPQNYLSLTKPHHLYGNMAEAFFKLKDYKNALHNYTISLQKANAIQWYRGIAVAHFGLGETYDALQSIDSSLIHYIAGVHTANASQDIDVALVCYSGMAKAHYLKNSFASVNESLAVGFDLLQRYPNINRFYAIIFLNNAIAIYKKLNNTNELINALQLKSAIETANITGNNTQIQTILTAGVQNEKRVLSLQVAEAKRKQQLANTRLLMALGGFVLLSILFLIYRYYQKQKLQVNKLRQDISQDLHDDIGASLSSLQIYSTVAENALKTNPTKAVEMLHKITAQSKQVMENMNDIVWSMQTDNSAALNLSTKIKNYSSELLSENNIHFACSIDAVVENAVKNIAAKRNVLLIVREALHNIAKYSAASNAQLKAFLFNKNLHLTIIDDGKGFIVENRKLGNGIQNMQKRTAELGGKFTLHSEIGQGTRINIVIPAKAL